MCGNPEGGIRLLDEVGLLKKVLPKVHEMKGVDQPPQFHPEGDVFEHTMMMLGMVRKKYHKNIELLLGVLLHDVGKPPTYMVTDRIRFNNHPLVGAQMSVKILKRLKFSNHTVGIVEELVKKHLTFIDVPRMRPSTLKKFLRIDDFDLHLELHRVDCLSSHQDLSTHRFVKRRIKEMENQKEPLRPVPLINGRDLIEMGLTPGPLFKKILAKVEDAQLEGLIENQEEAIELSKEIAKRYS